MEDNFRGMHEICVVYSLEILYECSYYHADIILIVAFAIKPTLILVIIAFACLGRKQTFFNKHIHHFNQKTGTEDRAVNIKNCYLLHYCHCTTLPCKKRPFYGRFSSLP